MKFSKKHYEQNAINHMNLASEIFSNRSSLDEHDWHTINYFQQRALINATLAIAASSTNSEDGRRGDSPQSNDPIYLGGYDRGEKDANRT